MPPSRTTVSCAIATLLACAALACSPLALAVFNKSATGGPLTVSSATLASAGSATATQVNCRTNKSPEIEVTWSATSSSYATSYTVERATASNGSYSSLSSVPIGETSYTDKSGSLSSSTTYYYRVSSVFRSWSTSSTSASVKTLSKFCV
jgi:hypothetical protein